MDIEKIKRELEGIDTMQNVIVSYKSYRDVYDIHAKIKFDEYVVKDIFNNIEGLDYQYYEFGIFNFWFSPKDEDVILNKLILNF